MTVRASYCRGSAALTVAGEQDVSGVEVSTQDALLMQTLQSKQDLGTPDLYLCFRQTPAVLQGLIGWGRLDGEAGQVAPSVHLYDLVFLLSLGSFWLRENILVVFDVVERRAGREPAHE